MVRIIGVLDMSVITLPPYKIFDALVKCLMGFDHDMVAS